MTCALRPRGSQLAYKWGHPQAAAINVTSWIGLATGGLLWPVALIWAFLSPPASLAGVDRRHGGKSTPTAEDEVRS